MTTLAPRRRKIFIKRGRTLPWLRIASLAIAFIAVAGVSFSAGIKFGANAEESSAVSSILAAYLN